MSTGRATRFANGCAALIGSESSDVAKCHWALDPISGEIREYRLHPMTMTKSQSDGLKAHLAGRPFEIIDAGAGTFNLVRLGSREVLATSRSPVDLLLLAQTFVSD
jgi:hypothetical protein